MHRYVQNSIPITSFFPTELGQLSKYTTCQYKPLHFFIFICFNGKSNGSIECTVHLDIISDSNRTRPRHKVLVVPYISVYRKQHPKMLFPERSSLTKMYKWNLCDISEFFCFLNRLSGIKLTSFKQCYLISINYLYEFIWV